MMTVCIKLERDCELIQYCLGPTCEFLEVRSLGSKADNWWSMLKDQLCNLLKRKRSGLNCLKNLLLIQAWILYCPLWARGKELIEDN